MAQRRPPTPDPGRKKVPGETEWLPKALEPERKPHSGTSDKRHRQRNVKQTPADRDDGRNH